MELNDGQQLNLSRNKGIWVSPTEHVVGPSHPSLQVHFGLVGALGSTPHVPPFLQREGTTAQGAERRQRNIKEI
jgi:hypothetical protein